MRAFVLTAVVLAHASFAAADGVMIESYVSTRPEDMSRVLAPVVAELADQGVTIAETYAPTYETRVSGLALSPTRLPADFETAVERGHRAWIAGRFDEAVATLRPLVDAAHANPVSVATNQVVRAKLLKALSALALSQQRLGDVTNAKDTIREIMRSFPDAQFSRATYGPDAYRLFEEVRREVGSAGRGRLDVEVSADQPVIFIDERFESTGKISRGDMQPGVYRVYAQLGHDTTRVHQVAVKADEDVRIVIDPDYDRSVYMSAKWSGLLFGSRSLRKQHELAYAARLGKELETSKVIVLGIDVVDGSPSLVGSVIDPATAKLLRHSSLSLVHSPSTETLRTFARYLAGKGAAPALDGTADAIVAPTQPTSQDDEPSDAAGAGAARPSGRRWMLWTGLGAIGVGLVGGGLAYKFSGDASAASDELEATCAVSCTNEQVQTLQSKQDSANEKAIVAGVAGGVAVVTGVVLVILSRRGGEPSSSPVSFVPVAGGGAAFVTLSF